MIRADDLGLDSIRAAADARRLRRPSVDPRQKVIAF
jgi:aryl carrier-like protein